MQFYHVSFFGHKTPFSWPTVCLGQFINIEGREQLLSGQKRPSCCRQTHTVSDLQKLRNESQGSYTDSHATVISRIVSPQCMTLLMMYIIWPQHAGQAFLPTSHHLSSHTFRNELSWEKRYCELIIDTKRPWQQQNTRTVNEVKAKLFLERFM